MSVSTQRRTPTIGIAAIVAVVVFVLFCRATYFQFVDLDDSTNVYSNHFYLPATLSSIAWFWRHPFNQLYTPVTNTLWGLCAAIARLQRPAPVLGGGVSYLDPRPFHLLGILAHVATAVLIYFLLRRLVLVDSLRARTFAALIGALFWAVHPAQIEPVGWVTGNNNVFAGFFGVVALLLYVRAVQENQTSGLITASLAYALAILSKPTAVSVPLIAVAVELFILRRPSAKWLPLLGTWAIAAVGLAALTHASSSISQTVVIAYWKRPIIALDAITFYLGKVACPFRLAVDYGRLPDHVVSSAWGYLCSGITLAVSVACVVLWRRGGPVARAIVAGFALLVAGVLPMLGLVPYYFERASTVADRYLYLALLGPAYAIAVWSASALEAGHKRLAIAIAAVAVLPYAAWTSAELPIWRDSITVFSHGVRENPQSSIAHNNLGVALADRGDYAGALENAADACRIEPDNADFLNNLGVAYAEADRYPQAIAAFSEAIRRDPSLPTAHYHLAVALSDQNDYVDAIGPFRDALRLKPDFAEAWFRLGIALGKAGRLAEATDALESDLRLRPGDLEGRYMRAVLLGNLRRNAESIAEFQEITRRAPANADAWLGLGTVQARSGDAEAARASFQQVLRLQATGPLASEAARRLAQLR